MLPEPEENIVSEEDAQEVEFEPLEKSTSDSPPEQEVTVDLSSEAPSKAETQEASTEKELEQYSNKVQKRIDKLTKKLRESERKEHAAASFAQNVYTENQRLQERNRTVDKGFLAEYETRLQSQSAQAKKAYEEAYAAGDATRLAETQNVMAKIAVEEERLRMSKQAQAQATPNNGIPQPQLSTPQAMPRPDAKAEGWAEKNDWFGENEPMTLTAFSIHRNLVEQEGFDPSTNEYYDEIDKRIRKEFPHKFSQASEGNTETTDSSIAQTVAPVSRASGGGQKNKRIRLTKSEVDMARRLNVPLEEYAKFVQR
jgi:hypothetical protein